MQPTLSIAIPTYLRPEYLRQALVSIGAHSIDVTGRLEVIVTDNSPDDYSEKVVKDFANLPIHYHHNEDNVGPVENILRSCEKCSGAYVMLLFDDDLLVPGTLTSILRKIETQPELGLVCMPLDGFIDGDPSLSSTGVRFTIPGSKDGLLLGGREAFEYVFLRATHGSGLTIRRDLLDLEGARRHAGSMYPQIYLVGKAATQADCWYFSEPLVRIRSNPVGYWTYRHDYMAGAVLEMLDELTADQPWGKEVRRRLIRKRILATYGPLFEAREASFAAFLKTVRGLASVPAYRQSILYWGLATMVGMLGTGGIRFLRRHMPFIRPAGL